MELENDYNVTDQELIKRTLNNDPEAFERLFTRYKNGILQMYLQRTGNNLPDANDMLQETFVKVYVNLHRYNPVFTFSQWVYTIARNTFIDYMRRRNDNILSIDRNTRDFQQINPASSAPTPEEKMILAQTSKEFDTVLEKLAPRYREMIVMRFVKEYSYEEIAEELHLPLGTVKTQIHRAREKLCELLSGRGNIF